MMPALIAGLFAFTIILILLTLLLLLLEAQPRYRRIERLLYKLDLRGEQQMTVNERIQASLTRIDTATNNIAEDIRGLKTKLEEGGATEEVLAGLESAAATLEGIAASTEDPVPGDGGGPADPEPDA